MSQWNIASYFIASMEKASFYEIIVMVNNKKRCPIKDTMSIKISFMHYRNYITWTRAKSAVAFEEFDMVYLLWLLFSFHYHCQSFSICKMPTLAKIWGDCSLPSPPGFYGPDIYIYIIYFTWCPNIRHHVQIFSSLKFCNKF